MLIPAVLGFCSPQVFTWVHEEQFPTSVEAYRLSVHVLDSSMFAVCVILCYH